MGSRLTEPVRKITFFFGAGLFNPWPKLRASLNPVGSGRWYLIDAGSFFSCGFIDA